ncbi:MAG TPA: hypothetical protein VNA14_02260 [Mycobacteriales bacterium]|nr:hypothetical protein [Mycobacteriales bacterium]
MTKSVPVVRRVGVRLRTSFPLLSAVVIGAVVVVNFLPVFFGQVPLAIDIVLQSPLYDSVRSAHPVNMNHADLGDLVAGFYPLHAYAGESVRGGDFPLWNHHLLLGQPNFAIYQPGTLYPPNLLYFVLPTPLAWGLLYAVRMFLAGWFTALFVRALGGSRTGSLVAGLSFAFCGFMLTWSGWPHVDVAVWLPLLLLAIQRLREGAMPAWAAVAAIAVGSLLLAGHPQTAVYALATATVFALHRLVLGAGREVVDVVPDDPDAAAAEAVVDAPRGRYLAWLAIGGAIGIGVAMVQLLPTAEWIGLTTRSGQDRGGHLTPSQVLGFLSRDARNTPNGAGILIPEAAIYVGMLAFVGAGLSLLSRRRRDVVLFGLVAATTALVAYGIPPLYGISRKLPVFSTLPNWRAIVLTQFAVVVLAGLGITALQRRLADRAREATWWSSLAALLLGGGFAAGALYSRIPKMPERVSWFRGPTSSVVVLAIAAILLSPPVVRRLRGRVALSVLLIGFVAVDLLTYGYGHAPFIPQRSVYPEAPLLEALRERDPGLWRIAAVDSVYAKNLEQVYDLETPTGTGYQIKAVDPILNGFGSTLSGYLFRGADLAKNAADPRLDLVNLKYLVSSDYNDGTPSLLSRPDQFKLVMSEGHVQVFENLNALPRAFVVGGSGVRVKITDGDGEQAYDVVTAPGFDPRKKVVVSRPDSRGAEPSGPSTFTPATEVAYDVNDIDVTLAPGSDGILAISDAWFPGWEVRIDGEERELLRVNGAFKGVEVGPDDRTVQFSYEPSSFSTGRILSGISLNLLLGLFVLDRVRRGRST